MILTNTGIYLTQVDKYAKHYPVFMYYRRCLTAAEVGTVELVKDGLNRKQHANLTTWRSVKDIFQKVERIHHNLKQGVMAKEDWQTPPENIYLSSVNQQIGKNRHALRKWKLALLASSAVQNFDDLLPTR